MMIDLWYNTDTSNRKSDGGDAGNVPPSDTRKVLLMQDNSTRSAQSKQDLQTTEEWREIPTNSRYEVSNHGRIRSWYWRKGGNRQSEPLYNVLFATHLGYIVCRLQCNGKGKNFFVHRLVMLAFAGESELTVNHRDGDKANNHLDNLEYMTHAENVRHSFAELGRKAARGQNSGTARLSDTQVDWLRKLASEGKTNVELAEIFNVNPHYVSNLKLHKAR